MRILLVPPSEWAVGLSKGRTEIDGYSLMIHLLFLVLVFEGDDDE